MMIVYPDEFKAAVMSELESDWIGLHRQLEANSEMVGRYIEDSYGDISPDVVVKLIESGKTDELLEYARRQIRRRILYGMWCDILQETKA